MHIMSLPRNGELDPFVPDFGSPIDTLIKTVDPRRAARFVGLCITASSIIERINPDVVVFPNRGAGPFLRTMEGAGMLEDIVSVEPPIGTANTKTRKGLDAAQKKIVLEQYIPRDIEALVIDESQHGGTIREHAAIVQKLAGRPVSVVQMQDDRVVPRYQVDDSDLDDRRVLSGPIFHIDRNPFLDQIAIDQSGARSILPNHAAREMFVALGSSFIEPVGTELLVGDQSPRYEPDRINTWVNTFNAWSNED